MTHLSRERIRAYRKKFNKKLPLYERGGCPSKLDDFSIRHLISEVLRLQHADKSEIYHLVRREVAATYSRRCPHIETELPKPKASQQTVIRWAKCVIQRADSD